MNWTKYLVFLFIIGICRTDSNNYKQYSTNIDFRDLTSLRELPIEKLLLLRQKLKEETLPDYQKMQPESLKENHENEDSILKDQHDRTSYQWGSDGHILHDDPHYDNENMLWLKTKGNIQAIFQTTVTVLAFLAFGGYLVCIILVTFRGGPQGAVVVQQTTTTTDNKVIKRSTDDVTFLRRKWIFQSINETEDSGMYALCQIAEGYAKYHAL